MPSNRREFLGTCVAAATWLATRPPMFGAEARASAARHWPAEIASAPDQPIPADRRSPFGWKTAAVTGDADTPTVLRWPELLATPGASASAAPTHLRLTIGLDVRDEKLVEAWLPRSNRRIGVFDIRFPSIFQIFSLPLAPDDARAVRAEGVALRLTKGSTLHIFSEGRGIAPELQPHLLLPGAGTPMDEYFRRMDTLACVQSFSWMEGCVLDGLVDLGHTPGRAKFSDAARRHLALYFRDGQLVYENHLSRPSNGALYGIEAGLPFAALARLEPTHPLVDLPVAFWLAHRDAEGAILDRDHTSSEGTYTVGYPLAEIARAKQSAELMDLAFTQARVRQARLFDGREFWRTRDSAGRRGDRNWSRGVAWQMTGLARILTVAPGNSQAPELIAGLRALARWVLPLQRGDGLWGIYCDEPELTPDTAGSAGIAVALALGAKHRWLDLAAREAAAKTLAGLVPHLTPDGLLGGVAQANKGGESLQRGDYRVIYQMGMGLMAQLIAALSPSEGGAP